MPGQDHDLLIRIDERVGEIKDDVRGISAVMENHDTRICALESTIPSKVPGIVISKAVAWAGILVLVLALGGALTLDLHKAGDVLELAKNAAGK